uniref:Uncharacterized protein n=1 Tax=Picea glauca TaxID=3330 RepID=A0A117NHF1_PICGL|nr:hypothetical protein ABT39_MTgene5276 [Picea glauca]QHR88851.1 hypothetical protein Q903MT_gene2870 [Picea sitchensis]
MEVYQQFVDRILTDQAPKVQGTSFQFVTRFRSTHHSRFLPATDHYSVGSLTIAFIPIHRFHSHPDKGTMVYERGKAHFRSYGQL